MGDAYQAGLSSAVRASDWPGWVWPVALASWDGREPFVSSQYHASRTAEHRQHAGVDIMYRRAKGEMTWDDDPLAHSTNKNYIFIMPPGEFAIAAGPGKIWSAKRGPGGLSIIIDHGVVGRAGGVTTYYQHLSSFSLPWRKGDPVMPGTPLGEIGNNPSPGPDPRHLHFEIRFPNRSRDPEPYLRRWAKIAIGSRPP